MRELEDIGLRLIVQFCLQCLLIIVDFRRSNSFGNKPLKMLSHLSSLPQPKCGEDGSTKK